MVSIKDQAEKATSTSEKASSTSEFKVFRPVSDFLSSKNMVSIFVGPKRKEWTLNEDLLCDRSEYFRSAFQGGFKEATEKEIYLEEEDPEAFAMFVDWVYGASLSQDPSKEHDDRVNLFVKLYCLAEFLCIERLMNHAMDIYSTGLKALDDLPGSKSVEFIIDHSADSPLRKYITRFMAIYLARATDEALDAYDQQIKRTPEITFEVLKASQLHHRTNPRKKTIWPADEPLCNYHLHRHTPKCGSTAKKPSQAA